VQTYLLAHVRTGRAKAWQIMLLVVLWACFPLAAASPASQAQTQSAADPSQSDLPALDSAKPIDRELVGGQKHIYRTGLAEEQYARVVVEQRGIDVVVRLLSADGKLLLQVDADPRKVGEEVVEFTTTGCGACQLAIEPRQKNAPPGRYLLRIAELRAATEKDLTLNEARQLNTQANRLWQQDKFDEALPPAERSLAIREKELPADHPDVGASLFTLANIWSDKNDPGKAEKLYLRALEIREKAMGPDHISVSPILNNLGTFYKQQGKYAEAEPLFERALKIREKVLDPDHVLIASVLNNLANIAHSRGELDRAQALYQRVIEIREKALGPEHPDVATALNNLANVYTDPKKSEPLYLRALAIREKALGPDHPDVAQTLYNLAIDYTKSGELAKGEELCLRAQSIIEKSEGPEHPMVSYTLNLLGAIEKSKGDYAQSETAYQRAIAIKEKTQGEYHPDLAGALANLADLYTITGDTVKAVSTLAHANDIYEYNIRTNLAVGSEQQKLTYLKTLSEIEDLTIMLHLQYAADSPSAAELAANTVLQRKARVLDSMANSFETLRRRSSPEDQQVLDQLSATSAKLARLVFDGPQDQPAAEHDQKIRDLEEQKENFEREVSRRTAGLYQGSKPVTIAQIQPLLPSDAALLEFSVYLPVSLKTFGFGTDSDADSPAVGEPRYVVYVLRATGKVQGIDLGSKKELDNSVAQFREALRNPRRRDVEHLGRQLYQTLLQPVLKATGDAAHLLISPDGELDLIPFEALMDSQDSYLVEKYSISYLTAGRDVLRLQAHRDTRNGPLVLADPSYGEPRNEPLAPAIAKSSPPVPGVSRRGPEAADSVSTLYFPPLGGTAQEARSIRLIFPGATILTGKQATKKALEQVHAPRILHIATHGFFLTNQAAYSKEGSRDPGIATRSLNANVKIENPLLRSGLAFSGANLNTGRDNGILTALEASTLDLWGTKLVTLSACDTGVGVVQNGEGVFGLRRSFFLAGAESLVMSLWPVSDYVTRELMTSYYKGLERGLGRGEALRQTKLAMLKRGDRRHPFFWASFIQAGEWGPLDDSLR